METKTLPAHAVYDEQGDLVSVAVLNGRATEFYHVTRMAFDDIGSFIKDLAKKDETRNT